MMSKTITRASGRDASGAAQGLQEQRQASRVAPNLSLERRLQLARGAACELDALVMRMRELEIADFDEDVAFNAFLGRMKVVADALLDVANPEEDKHHDAAELEKVLRFASPAD